jgi:hypothetical protein
VGQVHPAGLVPPGLSRGEVAPDTDRVLREVPQPTIDIDLQDFKKALERQGIDLIVEKIESEEVLRDILDFHVDYGQGYLFGEPKNINVA